MKTIRLTTCENTSEAYLLKGLLLNEGIDCFLTNENTTTLLPHLNNMLGSGIQIIVKEEDFHRAFEIIKDSSFGSKNELTCPNCNSKDIQLGLGKNKGLIILNIFFSLLAFIPFGNMKPKYHCKQCETDF
jgi:hypothetical protein